LTDLGVLPVHVFWTDVNVTAFIHEKLDFVDQDLFITLSVFCSFFHLSLLLSFLLHSMSISNFIFLYLHFFSPSSYPFFYILRPFLISSISTYPSFFIPFLSSILCLVLFLSISCFLLCSFPIFYFYSYFYFYLFV